MDRPALVLAYFFAAGVAFDASQPLLQRYSGIPDLMTLNEMGLQLLFNGIGLAIATIATRLSRHSIFVYPVIAAAFGSVGYANVMVVTLGIITVVWHGALGFFAAFCVFSVQYMKELGATVDDPKHGREGLVRAREDVWSFLKLAMQLFLGFAVLTGVTMTILFGQGYENDEAKVSAIRMATGFGLCAGSIYFWFVWPGFSMISMISKIRATEAASLEPRPE